VLVPGTGDRGRVLAGVLTDPAHQARLIPIAEVVARIMR